MIYPIRPMPIWNAWIVTRIGKSSRMMNPVTFLQAVRVAGLVMRKFPKNTLPMGRHQLEPAQICPNVWTAMVVMWFYLLMILNQAPIPPIWPALAVNAMPNLNWLRNIIYLISIRSSCFQKVIMPRNWRITVIFWQLPAMIVMVYTISR